jgi:hypothetical protein
MTLSRRKTLALIGGGTILAATAGSAAFMATRTPHGARAPWALAGRYGEIRRDALSWALLAPNPHNRQPWEAELIGDDAVALWRDPARALPETDPQARQLTIGMGCFTELMRMAAAEAGVGIDFALYPEGEGGPVAHARFVPGGATPDPLFAHAAARRSCKEPYGDRPVPQADAEALAAHGRIVTDPASVEALRALTWAAWETEMRTPAAWKESVDLLRFGKAQIEASPDGIDLSGGIFELAGPLGLISREALLDLDSGPVRQTAEAYRVTMAATPAHAVIVTPGNSRAEQIEAGRRWLRLNLAATARGLALHPVSQALQEYPEMAPHYRAAHEMLAGPGETVQMLGRLGYGPVVAQTPRWPLETRLRHA